MLASVGLLAVLSAGHAKVFGRCELARKLKALGISKYQIADWVCLAYHESRYNTAAVGRLNRDGSVDHGLFQISDIYWCDWKSNEPHRRYKNVCRKNCNSFRDNNIADDLVCVRKIYMEHQRLQGNGFLACWLARAEMLCQLRGVAAETVIPLRLAGGAFHVWSQLPAASRCSLTAVRDALQAAFALDEYAAYEAFAARRLMPGESADVFLADLRRLAALFGGVPERALACAFVAGLPDSVRQMIRAGCRADGLDLSSVLARARAVLTDERLSAAAAAALSGALPITRLHVDGRECSVLIDTGSTDTIIYAPFCAQWRRRVVRVTTISGDDLKCSGIGSVTVEAPTGHRAALETLVVEERPLGVDMVLGVSGISALGGVTVLSPSVVRFCGAVCRAPPDIETPDFRVQFNAAARKCFARLLMVLVGLLASADLGHAKVFERCELANELRSRGVSEKQLADWVCLAYHESRYDTAAVGRLNWDQSVDHGLFQISDIYWCDWSSDEPDRQYKNVCNKNCNSFRDDDIGDDLTCVMKIHKEHQRLQGNGFLAWVAWKQHCQHSDLSSYVSGCDRVTTSTTQRPTTTTTTTTRRPTATGRPSVQDFYRNPSKTNAHTHFNNLAPLANLLVRGARPQKEPSRLTQLTPTTRRRL
ncbi:Lysozyme C [Amphibalanus amphitrite]|uniref:lysozyme n=1 Tax=Amphibalanus amphitrite TaxID=1232801 RepID=A0A6A4VQN8_AMPAM|nr:Lysozyme C [Amphibalanus amphitrite]